MFCRSLDSGAQTQKFHVVCADAKDDDRNSNVVVTEQPHCIVGHPNALNLGDTMEETTIFPFKTHRKKQDH